MVIKKKIEKTQEDLRKEIIERGGHVGQDQIQKEGDRKSIVLRFPLELLDLIDKAVEGRYGMTRTAWLLQAAQEKLERDNGVD